jgi:hypothetical protein
MSSNCERWSQRILATQQVYVEATPTILQLIVLHVDVPYRKRESSSTRTDPSFDKLVKLRTIQTFPNMWREEEVVPLQNE